LSTCFIKEHKKIDDDDDGGGGNRLSGFDSVMGRILPFSYYCQAVAVNTVLALPLSL